MTDNRRDGTYAQFGAALALELLGAAGGTLFALQTWQTVTAHAPRPRPDVVVHVTGRSVDAAPLAFGLVALAGVVAVLATRGLVRRLVGVIVTLAGVGLVWRSATSSGAVSAARARAFVTQQHAEASVASGSTPSVVVHSAWPVLSLVCGVLVVAGGLLTAWHGHRWRAMSARYDNNAGTGGAAQAADPDRAAATMWTALDRGEDPTGRG